MQPNGVLSDRLSSLTTHTTKIGHFGGGYTLEVLYH